MLCSANFSSPFEVGPLAEYLAPNELQGLLPLFAAVALPPELKLCNRIGSGFRARLKLRGAAQRIPSTGVNL